MNDRGVTSTFLLMICGLVLVFVSAVAKGNDWPSFRGPNGSGVAKEANPPIHWNALEGTNIRWKTPIVGLGHSSPVIWGDRIFLTSAAGGEKEAYLRVGLYGESPDNPEKFDHDYRVICLDKKNGSVIWEKTAFRGVPKIQRHIKASHANCTVATDGKHVVAFFGSEGLYCFNFDGDLVWKKDLGLLDAGAFDMPSIQWGFGSSPIIYQDRVIVLCDVNNQSFIAAYDLVEGKELWRTLRDEVPTWGTPTIYSASGRTQAIVNGYQHIGGYDVQSGEAIWWMKGGGDIPVPRPVVAHDMVFLTNAHGRMSPIYAIHLNAEGDISLAEGQSSNKYVAWSLPRRGAYMPTPIVHGDYLYVGNDRGVLTCYDTKTGNQIYRERLGMRGEAFTASSVAAGDQIYFTSEDGDIHVVHAGATYRHLAANPMGEVCLATPAISGDMIFVRTRSHLFGIGKTDTPLVQSEETEGVESSEKKSPSGASSVQKTQKKVDFKDPVAILKQVDEMAKKVKMVSYDVTVEGTGAMKQRLGRLEASVLAVGHVSGLPEKFLVRGQAWFPGGTEPVKILGGCDGDRFYAVDHQSRKVHADFETSAMGSMRQALLGGLVPEFHVGDPFGAEIDGKKHELRGDMNIGGEDCWVIHVVYKGDFDAEATWYIGKSDFLPRGRLDKFSLPTGEKGGIFKQLSNLTIAPEIKPFAFKIDVPKGYTYVETPAP